MLLLLLSGLQLLIGIILLITLNYISVASYGEFKPSGFFYFILIVFFIIEPIFTVTYFFMNSKSHCNVYENAVTGRSSMGLTSPMQDFILSYEDIINVTSSGKSLILYTNHASYTVLAMTNLNPALQEIRARMQGEARR